MFAAAVQDFFLIFQVPVIGKFTNKVCNIIYIHKINTYNIMSLKRSLIESGFARKTLSER